MKNTNKRNGSGSSAFAKGNRGKFPVTRLPRVEMYAVLGLELSKTILEKLERVEESVAILARQKWRDLSRKKQPDATAT